MKKYNVAVVGASGNVGREILNILDFRSFPTQETYALASSKSEGQKIIYGDDKETIIKNLETFDFKNIDIVFSSAGSEVSKKFIPKAVKSGAIIIDNTSCFRMHKDVPLIVPEVNLEHLKDFKKKKIIANPNCSTIQMVMALKPIHDLFEIKKIVINSYK